jgi:transcription termination factor NusB
MSQQNALAAQRRKARHFGLQALYQWTLSGASATEIEAEFRVDNDFQHTDGEYFSAVLKGVVGDVEALEALFEPCPGSSTGRARIRLSGTCCVSAHSSSETELMCRIKS